MSPLAENLLTAFVFPGLPLLVAFGGAYFAVRHWARTSYVVVNVVVILAMAVFAYAQPTDPHAPNSGLLTIVFLFFYVPLHLGIVGVVCFLSLYLESRVSTEGAN